MYGANICEFRFFCVQLTIAYAVLDITTYLQNRRQLMTTLYLQYIGYTAIILLPQDSIEFFHDPKLDFKNLPSGNSTGVDTINNETLE